MFCKIPWHKIVPSASETPSWRATSRNNIVQTDGKLALNLARHS